MQRMSKYFHKVNLPIGERHWHRTIKNLLGERLLQTGAELFQIRYKMFLFFNYLSYKLFKIRIILCFFIIPSALPCLIRVADNQSRIFHSTQYYAAIQLNPITSLHLDKVTYTVCGHLTNIHHSFLLSLTFTPS